MPAEVSNVARDRMTPVGILCGIAVAFCASAAPAHAQTVSPAALKLDSSHPVTIPERPKGTSARAGGEAPLGGNPLWTVPMSSLTATGERPIFSASRRPPPVVVAPVMAPRPAPPPPQAPVPEHPGLELIGTVVSGSASIAIFRDPRADSVVRLRTGESHHGWTLQTLTRREARLEKGRWSDLLALPLPPGQESQQTFEISALAPQRQDGWFGTPGGYTNVPGASQPPISSPPAQPVRDGWLGSPGSYTKMLAAPRPEIDPPAGQPLLDGWFERPRTNANVPAAATVEIDQPPGQPMRDGWFK